MSVLKYYDDLNKFISQIIVRDKNGRKIEFSRATEKTIEIILQQHSQGRKLIFIGNGGSAAIASHLAIDFWKNGGIKAITFNDSSLLTCISNDYGYDHVFAKPLEMFANKGDVLFAISSSGRSKNILNGVKAAYKRKCKVITLSGFSPANALYKMGDLNFYVPSQSYSHVEIIHLSICHYIFDLIVESRKGEIKF